MTNGNNAHHEIETSIGQKINHSHLNREGCVKASTHRDLGSYIYKPLGKLGKDSEIIEHFMSKRNMFAIVSEQPEIISGPTFEFNCHGKTFDGRQSWIEDNQVPYFLNDDYEKISESDAKEVYIVIYRLKNTIVHSGHVHKIDGKGKVSKVQSKWGYGPELIHEPQDVPLSYGTPEYWRKKK